MMSWSSYPHKPPKGLRHIGLEAERLVSSESLPHRPEFLWRVLGRTLMHHISDKEIEEVLHPVL